MPAPSSPEQQDFDALLNKEVHLPVRLYRGAEPPRVPIYEPVYDAVASEFRFTPRLLLHAIGCRTARLSMREESLAVQAANVYAHVLDLRRNDIGIRHDFLDDEPDLLKNRSHELGIGIACLMAWKLWGFPWDQMEPIKGAGKRMDYKAKKGELTAVFEAKGATSVSIHEKQLERGIEQKATQRRQGRSKIELIIATNLASYATGSSIVIADPAFELPEWTFSSFGDKFYACRYWARMLNYIGDWELADSFYYESKAMLDSDLGVYRPRSPSPALASVWAGGMEFVGSWNRGVALRHGARYHAYYDRDHRQVLEHRADEVFSKLSKLGPAISVFQGLDGRVHTALSEGNMPPSHDSREALYLQCDTGEVMSVLPDGSVMVIRLDE